MELTNGLGAAAASSVFLCLRGALTHGFSFCWHCIFPVGVYPPKRVARLLLLLPTLGCPRPEGIDAKG